MKFGNVIKIGWKKNNLGHVRKKLSQEKLNELIEFGYPEKLSSNLANFVLPTIELKTTTASSKLKTQLCGTPDVPQDFVWPTCKGYDGYETFSPPKPLDFLAQIDLADLVHFEFDLALPRHGILSFFYDSVTQPKGYLRTHENGFKVFYFPDPEKLQKNPQKEQKKMNARNVTMRLTSHLPVCETTAENLLQDIGFKQGLKCEDEEGANWDVGSLPPYLNSCARIGGWADTRQWKDDFELRCEYAPKDTMKHILSLPEGRELKKLRKKSREWRLLLQLNSDRELNWLWGDSGNIQFWCRQKDIEAGRFDRCWIVHET